MKQTGTQDIQKRRLSFIKASVRDNGLAFWGGEERRKSRRFLSRKVVNEKKHNQRL